MRVLIAHSFYRLPGGEDGYVNDQMRVLGQHHDVRLFARENAELRGGLGTAFGMTYSRGTYRDASDVLRTFRPDIVHLHNAYPALGPAVHLAASRHGVPLVMTIHNMRLRCPNGLMFTEGEMCRRCEGGIYANAVLHKCFPDRRQAVAYASALWIHRFMLRLEKRIDQFIAPSTFMKQRMIDWGVEPDRVSVVRPAIPIPDDPPARSSAHGIYAGRLSTEKGVDVLLRALERAGDPPFRIVGGGPEEETLRGLAVRLGLKRTEFLGLMERRAVQRLIGESRFVVIPSRWEENAPLVAAEAMALGRALVVSDIGGLPEFVGQDRGVASPPNDVAGLAEAVGRMASTPDLYIEMGNRARAFAEKELSETGHLLNLESVYATILGQRDRA